MNLPFQTVYACSALNGTDKQIPVFKPRTLQQACSFTSPFQSAGSY